MFILHKWKPKLIIKPFENRNTAKDFFFKDKTEESNNEILQLNSEQSPDTIQRNLYIFEQALAQSSLPQLIKAFNIFTNKNIVNQTVPNSSQEYSQNFYSDDCNPTQNYESQTHSIIPDT